MSATGTSSKRRTSGQRTHGGAGLNGLIVVLVLSVCGCATHNHYQAARPVSATLEIEVQGQWRTVQRTVYEYQENLTGQQPEKASEK